MCASAKHQIVHLSHHAIEVQLSRNHRLALQVAQTIERRLLLQRRCQHLSQAVHRHG